MVDDEDWQYVRQEELKSREQARLIQLPRFALAALNEAHASQTDGNRGPMAPAIQGRAHGKFIAPRNVRRSLRDLRTDPELGEALAVTGLTQEVLIPHVLRRTAATLVAKSTGNLRASRELLGHADENTTRRSYAGEAYQVVGSAALLDDILRF
jgi:site-specific recombinase XerC